MDQRHDRRDTNRQRGRVRAMSVLGSAKSNRHRKTHQVESGGAGREFWHLTRGDLPDESLGGVSRGRRSDEFSVMEEEQRTEGPRDRLV